MGLLENLAQFAAGKDIVDDWAARKNQKAMLGLLSEQMGQVPETLPPGVQGPTRPGSGIFSQNPQEVLRAQALMAQLNQTFGPAYTNMIGAPDEMARQIAIQQEKNKKMVGDIDPSKFTGASIDEALAARRYAPLKPLVNKGDLIGKVNVGDFTPESIEAFSNSAIMGRPNYDLLVKKSDAYGPERYQQERELALLKWEPTYQEELSKGIVNRQLQYQDSAMNAGELINNINMINDTLGEIETGTFGNFLLELKKTGKRFLGMELEGLPEQEAARAFAQKITLQFRNASEGAGMPGHLSDKDLGFLERMTPNLLMTKDGRALLARMMGQIAKRAQLKAQASWQWDPKSGRNFFLYMNNELDKQGWFKDFMPSGWINEIEGLTGQKYEEVTADIIDTKEIDDLFEQYKGGQE